jgi:hypothetical protein
MMEEQHKMNVGQRHKGYSAMRKYCPHERCSHYVSTAADIRADPDSSLCDIKQILIDA